MPIELEVKEPVEIPEGKHKGKISRIELRTVQLPKGGEAEYVDIYITCEGTDVELKYGAPARLSPDTKLGRLVKNFTNLVKGKKIDIEQLLLGVEVEYLTMNETNERGTFARIVDGSIKPVAKEFFVK